MNNETKEVLDGAGNGNGLAKFGSPKPNLSTRSALLLAERVKHHALHGRGVTYGLVREYDFPQGVDDYVKLNYNTLLDTEQDPIHSAFFKVKADCRSGICKLTPVTVWDDHPLTDGFIQPSAQLRDGDIIEIIDIDNPHVYINWGAAIRPLKLAAVEDLLRDCPGLTLTATADRNSKQTLFGLFYNPDDPMYTYPTRVDEELGSIINIDLVVDNLVLRTGAGLLIYRTYVKPKRDE